jgi:hypothetical protein
MVNEHLNDSRFVQLCILLKIFLYECHLGVPIAHYVYLIPEFY